jgi:23S rRNA (cytosine1962-C5)-methyltransferase
MPAQVVLAKNLARSIREGHPWIFRKALRPGPPLPDGAVVEVRGTTGPPLATGFWDATSAIAVRILDTRRVPDPAALVRGRFAAALKKRRDRLDPARTNAFRWVHGEADRLPGLHLDLYGDEAVARFDGEGARAFYGDLAPVLRAAGVKEAVDRQSGRTLAEREVLENGIRFGVTPGEGGKGGLFLDQRENREVVETLAKGRSVLNLFGYSGGFSLYAARGGATSTDTVDIARPAIEAARANFKRNGLPPGGLHVADAFDFLAEARRRWDLVISDPPSFAPRKDAIEAARRAYTKLHQLAAAVVEPGGLLCAASCSSHVNRETFLRTIDAGARAAGRRFHLQEVRGASFDHPTLRAFPEGDYLKFAVGRILTLEGR